MKNRCLQRACFVLMCWACCASFGQGAKLTIHTDPDRLEGDLAFQGEYVGTLQQPDGTATKLGAQVRALGSGQFRTMFFTGGLPGAGWNGETIIEKSPSTDAAVPSDSRLEGNRVVIAQAYRGECDGKSIHGKTSDGRPFVLKRVLRGSPTMGARPPSGAIVLFDGKNTDEWKPPVRMTPQKWLSSSDGPTTKRSFRDFSLHVEFMIACVPETKDVGQRPNSGVYLQERYEIQVLDSFGVTMREHDCGVLYAQYTPPINMCYPPLRWQTYDIDFAAARYDTAGKKSRNARVSLRFNGVLTIDDKEIVGSTPGGIPETPAPAGIYLQKHTPLAFYRNIWLLEK